MQNQNNYKLQINQIKITTKRLTKTAQY